MQKGTSPHIRLSFLPYPGSYAFAHLDHSTFDLVFHVLPRKTLFNTKKNFLPSSRKRVVFSHYYYSVWHLFSHSYREPQEPPHAPLQEECDLQVALFSVQFIGGASIHAIPTAIHSFARTPPHRETERHDRRIVLGTRLTGTRHSDLHAPAGGSSGRIQLPFAHTDGSIPTAHKPVMLFPPPSGPSHPPPGGVSPYPPRTPAIIGYPLRS